MIVKLLGFSKNREITGIFSARLNKRPEGTNRLFYHFLVFFGIITPVWGTVTCAILKILP